MANRRFGSFDGVFTPTILTILGVIMYLRLGMVVGHAGLGGAILIILLAQIVSISTGLSISTIATNKRVGAGGAYFLISRSLGLEVGSAIGIPLYISQALGGAMYVIGFTEAWVALFPHHPFKTVASIVLVGLAGLTVWSASLALKMQFVIMAAIVASLVSFFLGEPDLTKEVVLWNNSTDIPFWTLFAIFFPAVTGIEAGAALSGEVKNPEKAIPRGMITAILISMVLYLVLAVWFYFSASSQDLKSNNTIIFTLAKWKTPVVIGILGATLSSALGSLLGAPRTLMALGQDRALPFPKVWGLQTKGGEPWFSLLITAVIVEVCILTADLNTIAPLLTMFFLITYGMVNSVVALEQKLGIPSFRPAFKVPGWIPFVGAVWCFIVMFLIHPLFATAAFLATAGIYFIQAKRGVHAQWGDVRSGLFLSVAEWALKISKSLPKSAKTWKPHLLALQHNETGWANWVSLVIDLAKPHGSIRLLKINIREKSVGLNIRFAVKRIFNKKSKEPEKEEELNEPEIELQAEKEFAEVLAPIQEEKIFAAGMALESRNMIEAFNIATQTMRGMHFPPNTFFLPLLMGEDLTSDRERMLAIAVREGMGIYLFYEKPGYGLGQKKKINIWIDFKTGANDLVLLTGYQLATAWQSEILLLHVVSDEEDRDQSDRLLRGIADRARLPSDTSIYTHLGDLESALEAQDSGDLNLFPVTPPLSGKRFERYTNLVNGSCLFTMDSGKENIRV